MRIALGFLVVLMAGCETVAERPAPGESLAQCPSSPNCSAKRPASKWARRSQFSWMSLP